MKILITGTAGFIGFHLSRAILENDDSIEILGLDNINDYYDINLKFARLKECGFSNDIEYNKIYQSNKYKNYRFIKLNLQDKDNIHSIFKNEKFDIVCNLAAQAGVRYSLLNPQAYIDSNITGFLNILESVREFGIKHLLYASSSSVYGSNTKMPFSTNDRTDNPISLYAASKKSNELMAQSYSHLFKDKIAKITGLRFFTVYGPWGRPDMALFDFTKKILENKTISIFNYGEMSRDFTYIDDIVNGILHIIYNKNNIEYNHKIYNIGNSAPVALMDFIEALEKELKIPAQKELLPMQKGDVPSTFADTSEIEKDYNYHPQTPVQKGIAEFVKWYRNFYHI